MYDQLRWKLSCIRTLVTVRFIWLLVFLTKQYTVKILIRLKDVQTDLDLLRLPFWGLNAKCNYFYVSPLYNSLRVRPVLCKALDLTQSLGLDPGDSENILIWLVLFWSMHLRDREQIWPVCQSNCQILGKSACHYMQLMSENPFFQWSSLLIEMLKTAGVIALIPVLTNLDTFWSLYNFPLTVHLL